MQLRVKDMAASVKYPATNEFEDIDLDELIKEKCIAVGEYKSIHHGIIVQVHAGMQHLMLVYLQRAIEAMTYNSQIGDSSCFDLDCIDCTRCKALLHSLATNQTEQQEPASVNGLLLPLEMHEGSM